MGDLSEHFDSSEFRCHHCGALPDDGMDDGLIAALEALRVMVGQPIHITSGYRCPVHNDHVGGRPYSYHLRGMAADIYVGGLSVVDLASKARQIDAFHWGGVGVYPSQGFVHVDVRPDGPARW